MDSEPAPSSVRGRGSGGRAPASGGAQPPGGRGQRISGAPQGGYRGRGRGPPASGSGTSAVHAGDSGRRGGCASAGRGGGHGPGNGRGTNAPRPTHFLALPLNHHSTLRARVGNFQTALVESNPPIAGLDPSIVIDPRRLHLTLGVMSLERNDEQRGQLDHVDAAGLRKTPETALQLLRSLQPRISRLLRETAAHHAASSRIKVPLEVLDVFPPGATTGANVLFLAPDMHPGSPTDSSPVGERENWKNRLRTVSEFVHQEFKKAGYITDRRPLTLHCTILNTSHRRPRRGLSFSYQDIIASSAPQLIGNSPRRVEIIDELQEGLLNLNLADQAARERPDQMRQNTTETARRGSQPLPVDAGVFDVSDIQLWVMGSHGPNNEYISLGGIRLEA